MEPGLRWDGQEGSNHSAWSDDEYSIDDSFDALRRRDQERRFMMTGGVYPSDELTAKMDAETRADYEAMLNAKADKYDWAPTIGNYTETVDGVSTESKAKQYFQKKLEQYGYAKHPDPHEYRLEDDFQVCKNCTTMSILNAYGLCSYCEDLSELNRRQAVSDGHMTEYHRLTNDISINHRVFYGFWALNLILITVLFILGWETVMISAGTLTTLGCVLMLPGYLRAQHSVKGKIRKLMEDYPELQKLAARPTTGSTGPR